jgi:hypothetical protein
VLTIKLFVLEDISIYKLFVSFQLKEMVNSEGLNTLYPLKFKPIYKKKVWGGNNISKYFNRKKQDGKTGESWEICCREDGMSVVINENSRGKHYWN